MRYFKLSEFTCKCGCGQSLMHGETLDRLNDARGFAGVPFAITSGYRCAAHNQRVGGKSNSAHTRGRAADVRTSDSRTRYLVIRAALEAGFTRIGIAKTFIHLDDDPSLTQQVVWDY